LILATRIIAYCAIAYPVARRERGERTDF